MGFFRTFYQKIFVEKIQSLNDDNDDNDANDKNVDDDDDGNEQIEEEVRPLFKDTIQVV